MIFRIKEKWCWLSILAAFLVPAILVSALAEAQAATAIKVSQMVSIVRDNVNIRSGPGKKYQVLWELDLGMPLRIVETRGNWYKVSDFEGDVGWVYKTMVTRTPHLVVRKGVGRVTIYSKPASSAKIVGQAESGVVFRTLDRKTGWAKVRHQSGLTGWIQRDLLWGW